ncbi:MAG: hypothetical protein G01um101444_12 [Parcubacteria group bacterium Gr01-1014_44]|nr:MAG: hypothetical protein G01um101444_12 [Parcubacteria group bacterium Gr01-1014_44]
MKKKIFLLFFLLGGVFSFSLFAPDRLWGKNALVSTITVSRAEEELLPAAISWLDKIKEGQELLKKSVPLKYVEKNIPLYRSKKVIGYRKEIQRQEIALAVKDTVTGLIFEKRYWLETEDIKKGNAIRRYYLENEENLPRFIPLDINEDFAVTVRWWNNFNSDLSIVQTDLPPEEQDRFVVVGNKFLMENKNLAYSEDQTGQEYSDIVYTPYSEALHFSELTIWGKSFLESNVEMAFARLKELGVLSRAFSGQLAADAVSPQFVKNLFLIEQIDPQRIFLSEDGGLKLAERVLVRLGANQEKTFRYTFSKTGALGLGQIMPRTYASIVKAYPLAKLMKDIDIGRVDIQNGIMASILTLDDHLSTVFNKMNKAARAKFEAKLSTNPDFINEVRAAVYNGGPGKYRPATATISLQVRETVDFVRKYKMVRDLKLFQ